MKESPLFVVYLLAVQYFDRDVLFDDAVTLAADFFSMPGCQGGEEIIETGVAPIEPVELAAITWQQTPLIQRIPIKSI